MMMLKLVRIEFLKTFSKPRTYIGFIAILILIPLTYIGIQFDQGGFIKSSPGYQFIEQNFIIMGNIINGYFVSQLIMFFLMVHIPFLIALVAGDQISGEATAGTLRMLLIRPPSRLKIIFAKIIVTLLYTAMLVVFLAILSLAFGLLMFGSGQLLVLDKGFTILTERQAITGFIVAYLFSLLSMAVVAGLAFLFSVLVENAIGPIIGTMAIIVVSVIISETPIRLFEQIRPFLFTTYSNAWQKSFFSPMPVNDILNSAAWLVVFMMLFFGLAVVIFNRKDILT